MKEFDRLLEIVAALRAPGGCPWDREQTIDSLEPFVLEEAYEVLQAIDRHDHAALCEELGDFVFEAVFLAQLESEAGLFTIADSLKSIADKLVRRHPHVFAREAGEAPLDSAGQVRTRWEEIKSQERRDTTARGASPAPKTLLSGIAPTLPALLRAFHIGVRAASVGFDWAAAGAIVDKIQEEVDELREKDGLEDEVAELLAERRMIVAIDRLEYLISLFEHERLQCVDRLLAIPGTPLGRPECRDDFEKTDELFHRVIW